jgi:hypothetical protein
MAGQSVIDVAANGLLRGTSVQVTTFAFYFIIFYSKTLSVESNIITCE